ncbi:hypothetical protein PC122_g4922 [Phytophthora cactorum]|nr:hypothetical protein PC122_g4922 [Phytophthora cactorum]
MAMTRCVSKARRRLHSFRPVSQGAPGQESDSVERTQPSTPSHAAYTTLAVVPRIAGKTLTAWTEFFAFWDQLGREQSVVYQTKDCKTTMLYNSTQVALDGGNAPRERSGIAPVKQHFELRLFELTGVVFKNPCHNHVNTETLCAALKQCKDRLSDSMLSMLDAFGQTNTDTKQIVSYVADTTGLPITTQQVRNLMNARLGHGNAEQRLKAVLTEFASTEDTEGVLLQGDWDQTVGIVLQTKAQREIFSRWGDTLALYWTHNCTDLGFYVAKRGFVGRVEVVQDEELVVKSIAELVIDKDFTEWSTLREAFPQAATLLCQFYAQRYVKRMMSGKKYFVVPKYRKEIEALFTEMLYIPTKEQFQSRLEVFERRVKKVTPAFAKYFDRNWTSCSTSAQCSTSIFDGSVSFDVCPPVNDPLPVALHRNCAVLSLYTLKLVNQQWESYQLNGKGWQWSHAEDGVRDVYVMATSERSRLQVTWPTPGEPSWDCLFFSSTSLPCKHLCSLLVTRASEEGVFEVAQLHPHWSMKDAHAVLTCVDSTMQHLRNVNRLTGKPSHTPDARVVLASKKIIAYVRLKKCARHLLAFFAFNRIIDDYRMDLLWLEQDWSGVSPMKHVFLERTPAEAGTVAAEVAQLFRQSSLSRTVVMPSGPTGRSITSTLRDLVGKVARNRRLNDAAMDAGLWHVSKYSTNRYAVDAVSVSNEKIFFPDYFSSPEKN